jgi:hypothetical protein
MPLCVEPRRLESPSRATLSHTGLENNIERARADVHILDPARRLACRLLPGVQHKHGDEGAEGCHQRLPVPTSAPCLSFALPSGPDGSKAEVAEPIQSANNNAFNLWMTSG